MVQSCSFTLYDDNRERQTHDVMCICKSAKHARSRVRDITDFVKMAAFTAAFLSITCQFLSHYTNSNTQLVKKKKKSSISLNRPKRNVLV